MNSRPPSAGTAGLSAPQQEAFERELRAAGIQRQEASRISGRTLAGPVPLSFAQERLWFFDQLDPGSAAYNVAGAVGLQGRLDVAALRRALEELARRYEALRTTIQAGLGGDQPTQHVHAPAPAELP